MSQVQAYLRVLYTVNNNPQYILAKSSSQVPAIVCTESTTHSAATTNDPTFARAPLKACLAVICDSSPELLQDPARDFSLYVLDPLEAQPLPTNLSHASDKTNLPRGVAVALGLMSWALESDDSTNVLVTGTILSSASPALEVVFALRETKRVPKPVLHSYALSRSTSTPDLSQPLHPWSSTSLSQPDPRERRTLTRSADFPELYIGPPRRAPGRPEGSTSKSKVKTQANLSSFSGMGSSNGAEIQPGSKHNVERRPKKRTKPGPPRAPPTHSPFICAPLTRNAATTGSETATTALYPQVHSLNQTQPHAQLHSQTQPCPQSTQNLLLGLLSAIPPNSSGNAASNTTPEQQVALVSALQGLLAANPHLLQLATTNTGSVNNGPQTAENKAFDGNDDADSDIVILDSSAIDTAAFRKPSHRQLVTTDYNTNQESPIASAQSADISPMPASTPPSGQEYTPISSQTLLPTATLEVATQKSKHVPKGRVSRGNVTSSQVPATPITSRTCKRKLAEYVQGEARSFASSSPPSPSPSMSRTSGRVLTTRQRNPSSPTFGRKSASSPSVRLPSMLDSMRSMANSGSRHQISASGSYVRGCPAFLTANKNGDPTMPIPAPPEFKVDHPDTVVPPSNSSAPGTNSLKRRLNMSLNEFMEEHEARKGTKIQKRPSLRHKSEADVSTNVPQPGPSCPVKSASSMRNAQSSPLRSHFRSDPVAVSPPTSTSSIPGPTSCAPGIALSTSTLTTGTKNPPKKFVVPAWARTSTATLPRLSEDVIARHQAEQEAKKAQLSLRRREAAKAKRKRLRTAERPSKESSDGDDDTVENDPPRMSHSSFIVTRVASLPPHSPPSLPVFASDAVEPIPSSPPQSRRQATLPLAPSTPPRKPVSPGSAPFRTPNKSSSCSLFTPSGQGPPSLFTPSTPSVTPCHTRVTFTRSPTVLHSGVTKSPRKNVPQPLWTPKRNDASQQTPRNLRNGRNAPFLSSSAPVRTPRSQTGIGTRAFLLPPPSPCTLRSSHPQRRIRSDALEGAAPLLSGDPEVAKQEIDKKGETNREMEEVLLAENASTPPVRNSPTEYDDQGANKLREITSNSEISPARDEYGSSPLPPSSPLPASPFSSPVKRHGSDVDTPTINNLIVPDSDILLPSVGDSDAPLGPVDTVCLSDDAYPTAWFTDSEASAWFTETEAWLTDTEGRGPLLTNSDGAWLSDSEAVFGDMSSLPPSSASNWLSDDADLDTEGDVGAMEVAGQDVRFDTAAFERAFSALVEPRGSIESKDEIDDVGAGMDGTGIAESEVWGPMQPVLGKNAVTGNEEAKVVQDIQGLFGGLMET